MWRFTLRGRSFSPYNQDICLCWLVFRLLNAWHMTIWMWHLICKSQILPYLGMQWVLSVLASIVIVSWFLPVNCIINRRTGTTTWMAHVLLGFGTVHSRLCVQSWWGWEWRQLCPCCLLTWLEQWSASLQPLLFERSLFASLHLDFVYMYSVYAKYRMCWLHLRSFTSLLLHL